jgi:FtsP/CotA-like multicopper oxidase with cupredoxin domain
VVWRVKGKGAANPRRPMPVLQDLTLPSSASKCWAWVGQSFDPDRIEIRVVLESTEDWLIINDDVMDYPIHLHLNPFQVTTRVGRAESQRH